MSNPEVLGELTPEDILSHPFRSDFDAATIAMAKATVDVVKKYSNKSWLLNETIVVVLNQQNQKPLNPTSAVKEEVVSRSIAGHGLGNRYVAARY